MSYKFGFDGENKEASFFQIIMKYGLLLRDYWYGNEMLPAIKCPEFTSIKETSKKKAEIQTLAGKITWLILANFDSEKPGKILKESLIQKEQTLKYHPYTCSAMFSAFFTVLND